MNIDLSDKTAVELKELCLQAEMALKAKLQEEQVECFKLTTRHNCTQTRTYYKHFSDALDRMACQVKTVPCTGFMMSLHPAHIPKSDYEVRPDTWTEE